MRISDWSSDVCSSDLAKELNNPVPTEPLLFIKAGSCTVPLDDGFSIPNDRGAVHYEAEIAVLIGKPLSRKPNERSEERRGGKECVSTFEDRREQNHSQNNYSSHILRGPLKKNN